VNGLDAHVLEIVERHRGRRNAIRAKTIASKLDITEREARDSVKRLIEVHHVPVASTVRAPFGFFIPESTEESRAYAATLVSRIRSTAERLHAFEANTADGIIKQLDLFGRKP